MDEKEKFFEGKMTPEEIEEFTNSLTRKDVKRRYCIVAMSKYEQFIYSHYGKRGGKFISPIAAEAGEHLPYNYKFRFLALLKSLFVRHKAPACVPLGTRVIVCRANMIKVD